MVERRRKTDGKRFYGCAKFGKGGCGQTTGFGDAIYDSDGNAIIHVCNNCGEVDINIMTHMCKPNREIEQEQIWK